MSTRRVAITLVMLACRREPPPPPPAAGSGASGSAVTAAAVDAGAADSGTAAIELLHSVASTVRVSSKVKNKKILPEHLVDGDPETAWNSLTGELVGAWIEVSVPAGAHIRELRLTAGFTASGPHGEDYFTMNPRIRALDVIADGKAAGRVKLDIARRDLQSIPLAGAGAQKVRVVVADVAPGSKKQWREVSVSELEAWGTPPPGWTPPAGPRAPTVEVAADDVAVGDPCSGTEALRAEFERAHKGEVYTHPDHSYPPTCETVAITPSADPKWADVTAWCDVYDEIYGPTTCHLQFSHDHESAGFELESQHASARIRVLDMTLTDAIRGHDLELVVHAQLSGEYIVVCRSWPVMACTAPMPIAVGGWSSTFRFEDDQLVREGPAADRPKELAEREPLVFQ